MEGTLDAPRLYHGYVVSPADREITFIVSKPYQKSIDFSLFGGLAEDGLVTTRNIVQPDEKRGGPQRSSTPLRPAHVQKKEREGGCVSLRPDTTKDTTPRKKVLDSL